MVVTDFFILPCMHATGQKDYNYFFISGCWTAIGVPFCEM